MITFLSTARSAALGSALLLLAPVALAAPSTKEECLDAFGKGQDARDAGQLVRAGKLFLACAQAACPELVVRDCARFVDELERQTPTVTFAARDGAQNDLPDTAVYLDGALVASRLGDGKAHEIDPGHHEVRFVHAGKEVSLDVVVTQGEKGRALVGAFPAPAALSPGPLGTSAPPAPVALPHTDAPEPRRPAGPLALVGVGAAAMAAGAVVLGVGLARLPANCTLTTHACAAPPKDPVFARASSSVTMVDAGAAVGAVGVVTFSSALIWYFAQPLRPGIATASSASRHAVLLPWAGPHGAGLSLTGSL